MKSRGQSDQESGTQGADRNQKQRSTDIKYPPYGTGLA